MNKQDKEKAKEISYHYLQQVDFYKKTKYDENDIISTARDAALEMAEWKEQQIIENACELYRKELVALNNLLVAYDKEAFEGLIMIDDSVVDFRNTLKKEMKEE